MKTLIYVGPHGAGVDVHLPDGRVEMVPFGGELKTSEEHAAHLLAQEGCWKAASDKAAKAAKED